MFPMYVLKDTGMSVSDMSNLSVSLLEQESKDAIISAIAHWPKHHRLAVMLYSILRSMQNQSPLGLWMPENCCKSTK